MKILIISNHSFPRQGPRAFRTAELAEQLAKMGHTVVVYSVTGNYDYTQYTEHTGVVMKDLHPRFCIASNAGGEKQSLFNRAMFHYFHKLLFWPQCEFHFIVERAVKECPNYDMLITIACPHSIHSGAARAKKKYPQIFPRVWIADCGDPFMLNPFIKFPGYMKKYEDMWCSACDFITIPVEDGKAGYYPQYHHKIRVIPQGFDFAKTPVEQYRKNSVPTFVFMGTVYPGVRDPHAFMDFLLKYPLPYKFKMLMHTPLEDKYVSESNGRIEYVIGLNRPEVIRECSKADFLINVVNPNSIQAPSKLIDYGIANRPILDIDSTFSNQNAFKQFMAGNYNATHKIENLDAFRIENVAQSFINLSNPQ